MPHFARLALGTVQSGVNRYPVLWGLLDLWRRHGLLVQPFRSHAELASSPGAEVAAGRTYRHLDGGMMFPRLCAHLLQQGARGCDLAVVDGQFHAAPQAWLGEHDYFANLCSELDLAAVVILNVADLRGGHLPARPEHLDAVILDDVSESRDIHRWRLEVETLWQVPVVGHMPNEAPLRAIANATAADARPSPQLCRALGNALAPHCDEDRLLSLARKRPLSLPTHWQAPHAPVAGPRIAVGIDEAMSRYFPENLELLSARGAIIRDFSPLRTVAPPDADIIYLSDGCLHAYAQALAKNHCLLASLRAHVAHGGLIYAEGMGAALLGRELLLPHGQLVRMAGLMPWSYRLVSGSHCAGNCGDNGPLQNIPFDDDNWLLHGCPRVRGYEGCTRLRMLADNSAPSNHHGTARLHAWGGAVASTLPLFFPAHPRLVRNFLKMSHERLGVM